MGIDDISCSCVSDKAVFDHCYRIDVPMSQTIQARTALWLKPKGL